jgi:hypothetical protein
MPGARAGVHQCHHGGTGIGPMCTAQRCPLFPRVRLFPVSVPCVLRVVRPRLLPRAACLAVQCAGTAAVSVAETGLCGDPPAATQAATTDNRNTRRREQQQDTLNGAQWGRAAAATLLRGGDQLCLHACSRAWRALCARGLMALLDACGAQIHLIHRLCAHHVGLRCR